MANDYKYALDTDKEMLQRKWPDKKSGMEIVGVAKFLGCEKTLVKNPSEAVGSY